MAGNIYHKFARYYDHYMKHVNYHDWSGIVLDIYKKFKTRDPGNIFELACGTGNFLKIFERKGISCSGSDSSKAMISIAKKKLKKTELYCSGMTEKLPVQNLDLIICLFDSLNYLLDDRDVSLFLDNTYKALKPNGLLFFDISTLCNSHQNFKDLINIEEFENSYVIQQAEFCEFSLIQKTKLTIFESENEHYKKYTETHLQRALLSKDILSLINRSPFQLLGIFSQKGRQNLLKNLSESLNHDKILTGWDNKYQRIYFALTKPE